MPTTNQSESLVLVNKQNGMVIIQANTPLTRLNYFDGKFLRAQDLRLEQDYLRQLVRESNQAGGPGVAHGFDLTRGSGDELNIGAGLAFDSQGRVLLLPQAISLGARELIEKSRNLEQLFGKNVAAGAGVFDECELHSNEPSVELHQVGDLFLIVLSAAEALCGEEDVYGKLCEEACVTSTDHPKIMEGITVRAVPLSLRTVLPSSRARSLTQAHLRSQVATAYFEDERRRIANLISKFGLEQQTWCLGADATGGAGVPIGVIARSGSTTAFVDAWIARRERIDSPAKRYWQWRMMMRPWDVFIAQVLQFQCQLHELFRDPQARRMPVDPCGGARGVINEAAATIADLKEFYRSTTERLAALNVTLDEASIFHGGLTKLTDLNQKLVSVGQTLGQLPEDEFLLRHGIVELPPAGYLPVTAGDGPTINQQVRRLMGEGVDLRFCVVRPDYVAHALEEAQHLERISLVAGLDDPDNKPQVDILVPDGKVIEERQPGQGGLAASLRLYPSAAERFMWAIGQAGRDSTQFLNILGRLDELDLSLTFNGAARHETLTNGHGFYAALLLDDSFVPALVQSFFQQPAVVTSVSSEVAKEAGSPAGVRDTAAAEARYSLFSTIKDLAFKRRERPELLGATILAAAPLEEAQPFEEPTLPAGLWLEATCDQDPRTMRNDQTLRINGRVLLASTIPFAGGMAGYFDVRFNVDALVTDTGSKADGSSFIKCNAAVFGSIIASLAGPKQSEARSVNLEIEIVWSTNDDGRTGLKIVIRDPEDEMTLIFRGTWAESSTGLRGAVTEGKIQSVAVGVRSDPDVLKSDDDRHRRAIKALETIGDAIRNPNFFSVASNRLFPPLKPASELIVRGTKDWAMFHRRRTRKCSIDIPPAPPPPPSRRYAITLINLEDRGQLESLRDALKNPSTAGEDLIKGLGVRRVDIVEFASGSATLVSQPAQIQNDWHARSPGNLLLYGGIASNTVTAAEGRAIAQGRLNRIEKVVSAISQPVPNVTLEVISAVPTPLVFPDTDGAIVMVTAQEVTTICNTVYRAEDNQVLAAAREKIQAGNMTAAINLLKPLGNVQFQRDQVVVSDTQSLKAVTDKWKTLGGSAWHSVSVFPTSRTADEETRDKTQTKLIRNAIREAMGEPALDLQPGIETTNTLPTQCASFSIITVIPSVCHTVYRARTQNQFEAAVRSLQTIKGGTIDLGEFISLGSVLFEEQSATLFGDGKSLDDVNAAWNQKGGGKVLKAAVIYHASPADEASRKDQAKAIAAKLGGAPIDETRQLTVVNSVPTAVNLPTACPVFSIIMAEEPAPPEANLSIQKSAKIGNDATGATVVTYSLDVANNGPADARTVLVRDQLPDQTTFVSATAPDLTWNVTRPSPFNKGPAVVTFAKDSMGKGSAKLEIVVRPKITTGSISNTATISSATPDSHQEDNSSTATIEMNEVASVCHTVYRARTQNQFEAAVKSLQIIRDGSIQDNVIGPNELGPPLGSVLFEEQSATVFGDGKSLDDVNAAWSQKGGRKVLKAAVIFHPPPADETSRQDQAKAIAAKLGGAPISESQLIVVNDVPTAVNLPTACLVFSILLPEAPVEVVCMSVYRTVIADSFNSALGTLSGLPNGAVIQPTVIERNKLDLINNAQFEGNTINVVGNSMDLLLQAWHATSGGGGQVEKMALVCRRPTGSEEDKGLRDQATAIATIIGSAGAASPSPTLVPVDDSVVFPTACRAFLIILASGQ